MSTAVTRTARECDHDALLMVAVEGAQVGAVLRPDPVGEGVRGVVGQLDISPDLEVAGRGRGVDRGTGWRPVAPAGCGPSAGRCSATASGSRRRRPGTRSPSAGHGRRARWCRGMAVGVSSRSRWEAGTSVALTAVSTETCRWLFPGHPCPGHAGAPPLRGTSSGTFAVRWGISMTEPAVDLHRVGEQDPGQAITSSASSRSRT